MLIFGLCDAKFASSTFDTYDVQLEIVNRGLAAVKGPATTTNQIHRPKFVGLEYWNVVVDLTLVQDTNFQTNHQTIVV